MNTAPTFKTISPFKTSDWAWDMRFMSIAHEVRTWSKDPKQKVGCLIVSPDRRQWLHGYNGFPAHVPDDPEVLSSPRKNAIMVHAEMNAMEKSPSVDGWTLYVTKAPCAACAHYLMNRGIKRVVTEPLDPTSAWYNSQLSALSNLRSRGVEVTFFDKDYKPWIK